ncbi:PHP domain-containing protein [Clostridium sp. D2Q-11]|uniref:PHP domain-containing protein n=1 Tax=Anaeromonas frigoriresistens TaxID=2683708 RepID=A0A942Z7S0_9FIRM|nr:PHP domain-containing protein [Anaeromonas frigoriresistens]MBS4537189.1 PHP domain-containing protein [Anaeromonas frigoriresistens]
MKLYYDLHIHSALSPCGDDSMTPNNIVNMAYLKGLDILAITDHNSYYNVETLIELGKSKDILVIPGMEVTTLEDIHLLCYFDSINSLKEFGEKIFNSLPSIDNNKELFGNQLILDKEDNVIGEIQKLLINGSEFSIDRIYTMVEEKNGVVIPAHVDKKSYSILSVLGFIPEQFNVKFVEIKNKSYCNKLIESYRYIYNSDAHYLGDINEATNQLDIKEKSIGEVLKYLKMRDKY